MQTKDDYEWGVASLARAPAMLDAWLRGIDETRAHRNEGGDSWSPFDIVGHLIHCEETDWLPRARIILEHGEAQPFEPFDRFAQMGEPKTATLDAALDLFTEWRGRNLAELQDLDLGPDAFARKGTHPELGRVTLGELLASWVTHDLVHIRQIARVLAQEHADRVGAWSEYLPILNP